MSSGGNSSEILKKKIILLKIIHFLGDYEIISYILGTCKGLFPFVVNRGKGDRACIERENNVFLQVFKNHIITHYANIVHNL